MVKSSSITVLDASIKMAFKLFEAKRNELKKEFVLHENNEQFRTLASLAPVGIYITDPAGNCQYANPTWCAMAGMSLEEALGTGWVNGLHPDDREHVFSGWKKMVESQGRWGQEYRFYTKEGKVTWVYGLAASQLDSSGKVLKYVGVNLDITERKLADEKTKTLLAEKELILKEVNHRIKNNMAAMETLLRLQADKLHEPSALAALDDAGKRMKSMRLLYEKLYLSMIFFELPVREYLSPLIDEILADFPEARQVQVEKRLDDFILDAKRLQPLGLIINELLTNIMKYAFPDKNRGSITVSALLRNGRAIFSVQDNGIGIPP